MWGLFHVGTCVHVLDWGVWFDLLYLRVLLYDLDLERLVLHNRARLTSDCDTLYYCMMMKDCMAELRCCTVLVGFISCEIRLHFGLVFCCHSFDCSRLCCVAAVHSFDAQCIYYCVLHDVFFPCLLREVKSSQQSAIFRSVVETETGWLIMLVLLWIYGLVCVVIAAGAYLCLRDWVCWNGARFLTSAFQCRILYIVDVFVWPCRGWFTVHPRTRCWVA